MTITEFLLERIAEDEAMTEHLRNDSAGDPWGWQPHNHQLAICTKGRVDYPPARVLAECEAKRAIIADIVSMDAELVMPDAKWVPNRTLLLLALPYADHPDYRQEWAL